RRDGREADEHRGERDRQDAGERQEMEHGSIIVTSLCPATEGRADSSEAFALLTEVVATQRSFSPCRGASSRRGGAKSSRKVGGRWARIAAASGAGVSDAAVSSQSGSSSAASGWCGCITCRRAKTSSNRSSYSRRRTSLIAANSSGSKCG